MDVEPFGFKLVDYIIDLLFLIDIIITCFLAYYDADNILVTNKKEIFCHYLRGWLLIDFCATIPISLIFESVKDYNNLARVARLPRLYRLVKMTKLARMAKLMRHKKAFKSKISKFLHLTAGFERLMWFIITFIIIVHLVACFWGLLGRS